MAPLGASSQYAFKEAFCRGFIAVLLEQDVKFGAVLADRSSQHVRLAAQGHEHFVQMLGPGRRPTAVTQRAKRVPNLSHQRRIVSWLTTTPRSNSSSLMSRRLS